VQAEQEGLPGTGGARHEVDRALAQQIGEIAVAMDLLPSSNRSCVPKLSWWVK
jgi:hypothetical protein